MAGTYEESRVKFDKKRSMDYSLRELGGYLLALLAKKGGYMILITGPEKKGRESVSATSLQ